MPLEDSKISLPGREQQSGNNHVKCPHDHSSHEMKPCKFEALAYSLDLNKNQEVFENIRDKSAKGSTLKNSTMSNASTRSGINPFEVISTLPS